MNAPKPKPKPRDIDFRTSQAGKRQSWFGLKRHVKHLMSMRIPNAIMREVTRLLPFLKSGRLPAPANVREVTGYVLDHEFVMLHPASCEIAKELFWGKGRRPRPADALALEIVSHLACQADVLLDIGAYTGLFTLAVTAVNPHLRAHAFDIVPGVISALNDNLERNSVVDRVDVHFEGIGRPGTSMRVPSGKGGSALPSFYSSRMRFSEGELVHFRSLDSMLELLPRKARVVIKIDVEGTENEIFRYGQELLRRYRPDILCEVLEGVAASEEIEALLESHGFRMYIVRADDLLPSSRLVPDPRFRDWLFTPRASDELENLGIRVAPLAER